MRAGAAGRNIGKEYWNEGGWKPLGGRGIKGRNVEGREEMRRIECNWVEVGESFLLNKRHDTKHLTWMCFWLIVKHCPSFCVPPVTLCTLR